MNQDQKHKEECEAIQINLEKALKDHFEYVLSFFLNKLDERIKILETMVHDKYNEGFIEGFHFGREVG